MKKTIYIFPIIMVIFLGIFCTGCSKDSNTYAKAAAEHINHSYSIQGENLNVTIQNYTEIINLKVQVIFLDSNKNQIQTDTKNIFPATFKINYKTDSITFYQIKVISGKIKVHPTLYDFEKTRPDTTTPHYINLITTNDLIINSNKTGIILGDALSPYMNLRITPKKNITNLSFQVTYTGEGMLNGNPTIIYIDNNSEHNGNIPIAIANETYEFQYSIKNFSTSVQGLEIKITNGY